MKEGGSTAGLPAYNKPRDKLIGLIGMDLEGHIADRLHQNFIPASSGTMARGETADSKGRAIDPWQK